MRFTSRTIEIRNYLKFNTVLLRCQSVSSQLLDADFCHEQDLICRKVSFLFKKTHNFFIFFQFVFVWSPLTTWYNTIHTRTCTISHFPIYTREMTWWNILLAKHVTILVKQVISFLTSVNHQWIHVNSLNSKLYTLPYRKCERKSPDPDLRKFTNSPPLNSGQLKFELS